MFILTGAELSLHFPREGETRHPANITHNFYYKQSLLSTVLKGKFNSSNNKIEWLLSSFP
jgi:hypothetical protein